MIRIPSCAPRPVPTSSAVGVARPSAHGQATIRTATVAEKANVDAGAAAEPVAERRDGDHDHDRHEDRRRRGRRAAAPAPCRTGPRRPAARSARARCRRRRGSRSTTSRPPALTVAPATASPVADLDRHALAGQQRRVDRGACPRRRRRRSRSSRPDGRRTGRRRRARRSARAARCRPLEDRGVLGAELDERAQRGPGACASRAPRSSGPRAGT